MKHTSTRLIFDYWNRQRGERSAPTRSEIDPAAIRHALGDIFMLAADFIDGTRFRLAGTRVCALFGREIKGEHFNALWGEASRAQIANIGNAAVNEAIGAVAGVTGRTEKGAETELVRAGHGEIQRPPKVSARAERLRGRIILRGIR